MMIRHGVDGKDPPPNQGLWLCRGHLLKVELVTQGRLENTDTHHEEIRNNISQHLNSSYSIFYLYQTTTRMLEIEIGICNSGQFNERFSTNEIHLFVLLTIVLKITIQTGPRIVQPNYLICNDIDYL